MNYHTIEEALDALRAGKCILVTDDPDRENEGDLICAGQFATTENVNLMASAAKGLICMPMSAANVERLGLSQMVQHNTDNHETAFTVSIDHVDTTTGISAVERGLTARMAADQNSRPADFRRPGHIFMLCPRVNLGNPRGAAHQQEKNSSSPATFCILPHLTGGKEGKRSDTDGIHPARAGDAGQALPRLLHAAVLRG